MGEVKAKDKLRDTCYCLGHLEVALQDNDIFDILLSLAYLIGMMFGDIDSEGNVTWTTPIIRSNSNYLLSYLYKIKNIYLLNATRNKSFIHYSNIFSKYYVNTRILLIEQNADPIMLEAFDWIHNNLPKVQEYFNNKFSYGTIGIYASLNNMTFEEVMTNNKDKDLLQYALALSKEMSI